MSRLSERFANIPNDVARGVGLPGASARPPSLLVVEDSPLMRKLIVHCLEGAGFIVNSLDDGFTLISTLSGYRPDMVLLDMVMPKSSGFDLIQEIRRDESLSGLKVVAVTNMATAADRERLKTAGFDGVIPKPINPQTFAGLVAKFLEEPAVVAEG